MQVFRAVFHYFAAFFYHFFDDLDLRFGFGFRRGGLGFYLDAQDGHQACFPVVVHGNEARRNEVLHALIKIKRLRFTLAIAGENDKAATGSMHLPGQVPLLERIGHRHTRSVRKNGRDGPIAAGFDANHRVLGNVRGQSAGFGQFFTFPVESIPAAYGIFAPNQGVFGIQIFVDREILYRHHSFTFAIDHAEKRVFFYPVNTRSEPHQFVKTFRMQHVAVAVVQAMLVFVAHNFAELENLRVHFHDLTVVDAFKTGNFLQFGVVKSRVFGKLYQIMLKGGAAWKTDTTHGIRQ